MQTSRINLWAALVFIVLGRVAMAQTVVLHDAFDGPNIGTNSGADAVGNGFFLAELQNATVSVAGGEVTIGGPIALKTLVSLDAIDPIAKLLTWQIAARPAGAANDGVQIGWTPDATGCCEPGIILELRGDRVVFDLRSAAPNHPGSVQTSRIVEIPIGSTAKGSVYTNATSPVTASLWLQRNRWSIDIAGDGVDIHRKGFYSDCTIINSNGQPCASPYAIFDVKRGTMHVFAMAYRENQSASFSDVRVILP